MKTRCRNYGATRRMTAGVFHPSRQERIDKDVEKVGNLSNDIAGKEPQVLHETRAQKQAVKNGLHEDHAETIKECDVAVASETTANNSVGVATRSSTRPSKRLKLSSPRANKSGNQENKGDTNVGHETTTLSSPQQENKRKQKVKRQWESWGKEEKDTFFEAVHEYGKDFDRICNFIAMKHKRRGDPPSLIKNKEQVRHFYYRTLNKIAKYLPAGKVTESDNHNKMVIELRGLICYGELRKKTCGWRDKDGKKLHDLVSHGTTSIRYNGRNSKIKAPVCRALKRLMAAGKNKEDKQTQNLTIPNKLVLELLPHNYAALAAVQRLAKNPRLRTTVPPKKSLSLMLEFLKQKWRVMSSTSFEPLEVCVIIPPEFQVDSNILDNQLDSPAAKNSPGIAGDEHTSSMDTNPCTGIATNDSAISLSTGSLTAGSSTTNEMQLMMPADVISSNLAGSADAQSIALSETIHESDKRVGEELCTAEDPRQCSNESAMDTSLGTQLASCGNKIESSQVAMWTSETCGSITFGEIFCKLGRPPKLKLEYTWQDVKRHLAPSQTSSSLQRLVDIASFEFSRGRDGTDFAKPISKSADVPMSKSVRVTQKDRTTSSTTKERTTQTLPKEKAAPKVTRVLPKAAEKLPFILPSVAPSALQTSVSKTIISDLQIRPKPRVRKRTRSSIQRTLLPRPVGSPSSVPPGAVAVSFIPQPGQTVGTILASGASTSSISATTQSIVSSPAGTAKNSEPSVDASVVSSPEVVSETTSARVNSDHIELDMHSFSEADLLDVSCFQVDELVNCSKASRDKNNSAASPVDSIIGLALGTALDVNVTNTPTPAVNEDSGSDLLASITGLKRSNLEIPSQPATALNSNMALSTSEVHIEELNCGVAGGIPAGIPSPTLNSFLSQPGASVQSSVATSCNVFFSSTEPICNVVNSQSQHKEGQASPSLMLSPSGDSELHPSFQGFRSGSLESEPQWLNGEASNFSLGSLLDKLTTSPRKEAKEASLGESSCPNTFKEPVQDPLINPHHLLDADTALHAMMDENSVDYVKKFEDLAKEMAGNNAKALTSTSSNHTFPPIDTNSGSSEEGYSDSLSFRSILRQNNMNGS